MEAISQSPFLHPTIFSKKLRMCRQPERISPAATPASIANQGRSEDPGCSGFLDGLRLLLPARKLVPGKRVRDAGPDGERLRGCPFGTKAAKPAAWKTFLKMNGPPFEQKAEDEDRYPERSCVNGLNGQP
tara:strand:- start:60081 stop:60470 length:390 start_codon:yes stop_codon:yes gene_type:complete